MQSEEWASEEKQQVSPDYQATAVHAINQSGVSTVSVDMALIGDDCYFFLNSGCVRVRIVILSFIPHVPMSPLQDFRH